MQMNIQANTIVFEGVLDERSSSNDLANALQELKKSGVQSPITVDLSNVTRANSTGIFTWLRFLKAAGIQFRYINVPVWLVGQFNMVVGYFEHESFVESFYAPFYSPKSRASKNLLLIVGKDVPIQNDYTSLTISNRKISGDEFEVDFDPGQYFKFIAENHDAFRKSIS